MVSKRMLSNLIVAVSCLVGLNNLQAQENWRLGIDITPSYFMMYNKTDWDFTFRYPETPDFFDIKGLVAGVRLSVDLNEYIGLNSGLRYMYSRQDYKQASGDIVYSSYENYFTTKQVQLPILFSIGTSNRDNFRFYGNVGFGLTYRLSYTERLALTTKGPEVYSWYQQYEGEMYSQTSTRGEGTSNAISIDKMYKDFNLIGILETGVTRTYDNGIGFNVAFQFQCGITNPENREAQFYNIPEGYEPDRLWYTPNGTKWWTDQAEEDVRPQTFPMHFGVLFGVYYQFGY